MLRAPVAHRILLKSLLLFSLFLAGGTAASRAQTVRASAVSPASNAVAAPLPYLRIATPDTNVVQLQVALRKFSRAGRDGPAIWLTGASHIGDLDYYRALQKHLDAQTLVLYEGVGGHPSAKDATKNMPTEKSTDVEPSSGADREKLGSLQMTLADALGLAFQLDAIDYDRPNFRNCDLSIRELLNLMSGPTATEQAGRKDLEALVEIMQGDSILGSLVNLGARFISSSPKLRATTRLTLIEVLGQMSGDLTQLQGLPPELKRLLEVLVQRRNQKVFDELKSELKMEGQGGSISIFYGTAHMDDLEQRLRNELNYLPVEVQWLTAFSVNLTEAGISPQEREMIRGFAKWQMEQMRPKTAPSP